MKLIGIEPSNGNKYRLRWEDSDGSKHSKIYPDAQSAQSAAEEILGTVPSTEVPAYDGTSTWWSNLLAKAAREVAETGSEAVMRKARTLSALAGASAKHVDISASEKRLAELEAAYKKKEAAKGKGKRK